VTSGGLPRGPERLFRATNSQRRQSHLNRALAISVLCLLSGCYFALVIAPVALGEKAPTVQQGLFPEWLGVREILEGHSPYRQEITDHIQVAIYGSTPPGQRINQQRFAYPAYFAFLFLPLAIVPFSVARVLAFAGCLASTIVSVCLWCRWRGWQSTTTVMVGLFVFASYPAILGLQLCQPSLLIAGMLAVVVFWAPSGRQVPAGILAALCSAKPQLAVAILLPLSIWTVTRWRARKRFAIAYGCSLSALLLAAELLVPGWFPQWLMTVRAYSEYAGSKPLLSDLLHGHFFWETAVLLMIAAVWVSYKVCEADLLFAISFSIAVFQLLFPFLLYNEILLLPAALWLMRTPAEVKTGGQLFELLWVCSWALLTVGAAASLGLAVSNLIVPGSGLKLWQLPFVTAWLYPWSVLLALACYAVCSRVSLGGAKAQP
jgi:hypothetical protein